MRTAALGEGAKAQGETGRRGTLRETVTVVTRTEAGALGPSGAAMQQSSVGADRMPSGQHSWQSAGGADAAHAAANGVLVITHRPSTIARTTRRL